MPLSLRNATAADYRALTGRDPPECWFGFAGVEEGAVVALGGVTWRWDARRMRALCWCSFDARVRVPAVTMHRLALKTLRFLAGDGEPAAFAFCDHRIPGAEKWLRRLGFAPDAEMSTDYREQVWSRRFADG